MNLNDTDNLLPLPMELILLVEREIWPGVNGATNARVSSLIDWSAFKRLIPDESDLLLSPPPFKVVSKEVADGSHYWAMPEVAIHKIDPEKTVVVGNFGHGSDTALALDYRSDKNCPSLIRLKWEEVEPKENNSWVHVSPTFGDFCRAIGLL